jgi:hypothetical protein
MEKNRPSTRLMEEVFHLCRVAGDPDTPPVDGLRRRKTVGYGRRLEVAIRTGDAIENPLPRGCVEGC